MPRRQLRGSRGYVNLVRKGDLGFINPYPYMSDAEAMVHLELERRYIPFSWRYFDGVSPWLQELLPDYAPEFTLREQKLVIVVVGEYFGTLPGIIDRQALAQAALEEDGWKVVSLFSFDILNKGADLILTREIPELSRPVAKGKPRKSPFDPPTYFQELRKRVSALALQRGRFALEEEQREKDTNGPQPRRTRPRRERRLPRRSSRSRNREGG